MHKRKPRMQKKNPMRKNTANTLSCPKSHRAHKWDKNCLRQGMEVAGQVLGVGAGLSSCQPSCPSRTRCFGERWGGAQTQNGAMGGKVVGGGRRHLTARRIVPWLSPHAMTRAGAGLKADDTSGSGSGSGDSEGDLQKSNESC